MGIRAHFDTTLGKCEVKASGALATAIMLRCPEASYYDEEDECKYLHPVFTLTAAQVADVADRAFHILHSEHCAQDKLPIDDRDWWLVWRWPFEYRKIYSLRAWAAEHPDEELLFA